MKEEDDFKAVFDEIQKKIYEHNKKLKWMILLYSIIGVIGIILIKRVSVATFIILPTLKLTNLINIDWFSNIYSFGAISTGLWIVLIGVVLYFLSFAISIIHFKLSL